MKHQLRQRDQVPELRRPEQARAVADRHFADAEALRKTGDNVHAIGTRYLAGYVIECLLKAKLLEKYPWLRSRNREGRSQRDRRISVLCHQRHDLNGMLDYLDEVRQRLQSAVPRVYQMLRTLEWSSSLRYSTRSETMTEAAQFLDKVKELKKWLA